METSPFTGGLVQQGDPRGRHNSTAVGAGGNVISLSLQISASITKIFYAGGNLVDQPSLSVIIPAYNEEKRLPVYLTKILAYLDSLSISYEVLVVDDGSVDSTAKVVQSFSIQSPKIKLIRLPSNRGKGFAVKTGMLTAVGHLRLFADADGATPITELERLKEAVGKGADIAIASRALHNGTSVVRAHLHRKVIGTIFNALVQFFAVEGIKDTQCGFKLFTAAAAKSVFVQQVIEDFGFDVEILFISQRQGYRIAEVAVDWCDIKGSKVRLLNDSLRMFIDIIRIRKNCFCGLYNSALPVVPLEERKLES